MSKKQCFQSPLRFCGSISPAFTHHFSWDYMSGDALVHVAAINSEMYYTYVDETIPPDYSWQRAAQWAWLDADLTAAKERGASWQLVYAHRPLYCSNVDDMPDCSSDAEMMRKGWTNGTTEPEWGLETLFLRHKIDLFISGHEHSYERIHPVYNGSVDWSAVSSDGHTYTNAQYPVYIVTGSAGCQELFDLFDDVFMGPWSAARSSTYGFGSLQVHNTTHLFWEQILDEGNQGTDIMWIIKDAKQDKDIDIMIANE